MFTYAPLTRAIRTNNVMTGTDAVAHGDAVETPAVPVLVTAGG